MKPLFNGLRGVSLVACLTFTWVAGLGQSVPSVIVQDDPIDSADETVYADEPYWYKPGHPLRPAEASSIRTLPGFRAERILDVPEAFGSWTAITVDPQGRLITAAQHRPGLYRITPPPLGDTNGGETRVEVLQGAANRMGWSHGLLHAFDSLYVTVTEGNETTPAGVYRLQDTDGDDQYDQSTKLLSLNASGEHGPHNMVVGPGGESLYFMCGNGTRLPEAVTSRRPVATEGTDHVMPPGFESSEYTLAGFVLRFSPDGGDWEVMCGGLRNSFDLAFNRAGDLFTFDSDMEWDLGTPWYRPTRICHLVSGGEFGWRGGAAKWPEYFDDSMPAVVDIGPASPTGVLFGYGARFPDRYQRALYACDWTFATIHAVHLIPDGGSYRAEVEEFVGGSGFPVTDAVIGKDGAMYVIVGGRRLGSAVYRIAYQGELPTEPAGAEEMDGTPAELHAVRRRLESFHGEPNREAVSAAWPYLGDGDRAIRFAARVALETQPVAWWREQAYREGHSDTKLTAMLALARQGDVTDLKEVIRSMARRFPQWAGLTSEQKLRVLRALELAFARGGDAVESLSDRVIDASRPRFPDVDLSVNRELARLLCLLGDPSVIQPVLELMARDSGERPPLGSGYFVRNPKYGKAVRDMLESAPLLDRMHYAQMLLWMDDGWHSDQRRHYFELMADAMANSKGGHGYRETWERIREVALDQVPETEREHVEAIRPASPAIFASEAPIPPKGPGREWTLSEALEVVETVGLEGRDVERGRALYAAVGCAACHRAGDQGGAIGPDLSTLGQRFTVRDILDATIHPSRAISDQYRVATLELKDGGMVSGRIVSQDSQSTRVAMNLMRPTQSTAVPNGSIRRIRYEPVSTMPPGLVDPLNERELMDLVTFLLGQK